MDFRAYEGEKFPSEASAAVEELLISELQESVLAMVGGGTGETIVG